ncbi:hypothetical protein [Mycobacteroides salmoniphilum]|uniref:hypothetical protein n=1 Tax=Mycobacteroides salmoniphilum TaxID=404941 RepID=UPI0010650A7F|nr:hypothetical protein [Mycobacteroides salmoniphilum]TDZ98793.1 hypothetical protein CCUG62472_00030 [Mycobacteroides salmoniphilum]
MTTTKYDYEQMQMCVDEVEKATKAVETVLVDLQAIIDGIEDCVLTKDATPAMVQVYKSAFQKIDDEVLQQLLAQKQYVENCMEEARAGDAALAGGWG